MYPELCSRIQMLGHSGSGSYPKTYWQILSVHHRTASRLLKHFKDFLSCMYYVNIKDELDHIKVKMSKNTNYKSKRPDSLGSSAGSWMPFPGSGSDMAKMFRILPDHPKHSSNPRDYSQQYVRYDSTKNLELYIVNKYFPKKHISIFEVYCNNYELPTY